MESSKAMFISSLMDDLWKKLYRESSCRSEELKELIEQQKSIWTPPSVFEKCCPRWLANGKQDIALGSSQGAKSHSLACPGGCHKVHPSITLFFDSEKSLTLAILSHRLDPFILYLEQRVSQGTARRKTSLYYEIDGFVRENRSKMRLQQIFGSHLVDLALGALQDSDLAQKNYLEKEMFKKQRKTKICPSIAQLQESLEICFLHGLDEYLDVMSIYCFGRSSKSCRQIANCMARKRMKETRLIVSPLVDGHFLDGYSVFRRSDHLPTVFQKEQGRLVEYTECDSIVCNSQGGGVFAPCIESSADFEWSCEELSFQTLERDWGDIGVHEYIGQKLVVYWECSDADLSGGRKQNSKDCRNLPFVRFRLNASPKRGSKKWSLPFLTFEINVLSSGSEQIDDVTVSFRGLSSLVQIKMDFLCLVRAYASSIENELYASHKKIEEVRPLLSNEKVYLREIQEAASLGT